MIKFKDYQWVFEGLAALVLLVTFVVMLVNSSTEVGKVIIQLTGIAILFFTVMRIKPILAARNEKDYLLVMFAEMFIALIVGVILLALPTQVTENKFILSFSRLVGLVLFLRGVAHFWTTVKRYELHDIISFVVNVFFISFGFLFLWTDNLKERSIVIVLMVLSALLSVFFGYRSYGGYSHFRINKQNIQKMGNYIDKKKKPDKTIEDPKIIDKKIDEPEKEKRPSIDVN